MCFLCLCSVCLLVFILGLFLLLVRTCCFVVNVVSSIVSTCVCLFACFLLFCCGALFDCLFVCFVVACVFLVSLLCVCLLVVWFRLVVIVDN